MTPEELIKEARQLLNTDAEFRARVRAAVRVVQVQAPGWKLQDERNIEMAAAVALALPLLEERIATEAVDPPFLHDHPIKLNYS